MYLLSNKQQEIIAIYKNDLPVLTYQFTSYCNFNEDELTECIENYFRTIEISFMHMHQESGVHGFVKGDGMNVKIQYIDQDFLAETSKQKPVGIHILAKRENKDKLHITIKASALYFDSWSLLRCGEQINNILSGETDVQEEEIAYTQFLGWKASLHAEPEEKSISYWKEVLNIIKDQSYNWSIPCPKDERSIIYSKPHTINKSQLLEAVDTKVSVKDILRYLWVNLLLGYTNSPKLILMEHVSSRVFPQLEKTLGALDVFCPVQFQFTHDSLAVEEIKGMRSTIEKVNAHINYFNLKLEGFLPDRTAAFEFCHSNLNNDAEFELAFCEQSAMSLQVVEFEDALQWKIVYNKASFNHDWIHEIEKTLQRSIEKFNLDSALTNQELISIKPQRSKLIHESKEHLWLHIEKHIKNRAKEIAIHTSEKKITYEELGGLVNKVASNLYQKGIDKDKKVVIDVTRSAETIILILSLFRNGATFIPIDLTQGESRIKLILDDLNPFAIISQSKLTWRDERLLNIDVIFDVEPEVSMPSITLGNQIAYILYTSGSTGVPKGCPIKMSNFMNYLNWSSKSYFSEPKDGHFAWFTPLTFDLTLTSIFLPLLRGHSLYIYENNLDTTQCLTHYLEHNSDYDSIKLTPAHITLIENLNLKTSKIKTVIIGGDILRSSHVNTLQNNFIGGKYYNEYGPTEATIGCVVKDIVDKNDISVGQSIDNMSAKVFGEKEHELSAGIVGEVCLKGAGLMDGYWNRNDLNLKVFFKDIHDEIWYRTGDLGYKNLQDDLYIIGRKDSQIKIRGYRVELNEIISFIEKEEKVAACELLIIGKNEDVKIVACIQSEYSQVINELKTKINSHFPDYMIPSDYVIHTLFPINKNGKTDKKELLTHYEKSRKKHIVHPESEQEEQILKLWEALFNRKDISVTSNFFEEGGHSLSATKLVASIRRTTKVSFSLKDIYKANTIRAQVALIKIRKQGASLEKAPESALFPLSSTQKLFWISENKAIASVQYTMPGSFKIKGKLDINILRDSFNYIMQKHEVFRTIVVVKDEIPYLKILGEIKLPWEYSDDIFSDQEITNQISKFKEIKFDLNKGPLFRIKVIKNNENEHYLMFNFHHIIFDGWSEKVLFDELNYFYTSLLNKEVLKETALEWQARDFSCWMNKKVDENELNKQLKFWKENLANYHTETSFPPYQELNSQVSNEGTAISFSIKDKALIEGLEGIGKASGTTSFSIWLALFKILLYKYTGEQNWSVGVPFANRELPELKDQIGCYLKILPVASKIREDDTLLDQSKEEQNKFRQVIENSDCPYEDILELHSTIASNEKPLYDVMLTWLEEDLETKDWQGLEIERIANERIQSKLGFVMSVRKSTNELQVEYDFKNDLFSIDFVKEFQNRFVRALRFFTENSERKISSFEFMTQKELLDLRKYETNLSNDTSKETLVDCWNRIVKQHPEKPCVIENEVHTYQQVDFLANQFANCLAAVNKEIVGGIIAVEGYSGTHLIASILAILKIGAIYLPIDTLWPDERKKYVLEKSQCGYIITNQLWELPKTVTLLNLESTFAHYTGEEIHHVNVAPEDPAYIIFTSGSTGKPKGVQIKHEAFVNMIKAQIAEFDMGIQDVVMPMASVAFDASMSEYFMALFSGGGLCFPSEEDKQNPKLLKQKIEHNKVTTITLTPSVLRVFKNAVASLNKLICAGEALSKDDLKDIPETLRVFNAYGPTECAVCTSMYELTGREDALAIPIGKPVANLIVAIMLPNRERAAHGIKGELCVGGWPVSSTYIGEEAQQKNVYFTKQENGITVRYYATGDLVKRDAHGDLIYEGRLDHQVQIGGRRVELLEIKKQLLSIETIEDALVHYSRDQGGVLIAWILTNEQHTNKLDITLELEAKLPAYMVPTALIIKDHFPLTSSGKTDVNLLLKAFFAKKHTLDLGKTHVHTQMIAVWSEILSNTAVHDETNFFKEGGNSLSAIQLISRIQKKFNISINIKKIYLYPVLKDLASNLLSDNDNNEAAEVLKSISGLYIANSAQKRLWAVHLMNTNPKLLNMPLMFVLNGKINKEVFQQSINQVLSKHSIFRSVFEFKDGELFIRFDGPQPKSNALPDSNTALTEASLLKLVVDHEFDLEYGNLIKIFFDQIDIDTYFFGLNVNHLIADNWTIYLFLNEVFDTYNGDNNDLKVPEEVPKFEYAHYLESNWAERPSEKFQKAAIYWERLLANTKNGNMLALQEKNDVYQEATNNKEIRLLLENKTFGLEDFITKGYTTYQYWLALINITHFAINNQKQLAVVSPVAARTNAKYSEVLGLFMNMNPVISELDEAMSLTHYFNQLKANLIKSKEFEDYPYVDMLKTKSIKEDTSLSEFIQVELQVNEIDEFNNKIKLPKGITVETKGNDFMSRKYDLEFHFNKTGDHWEFCSLWNDKKYNEKKIRAYLENLTVMGDCLKNIDFEQSVGDVMVLFKERMTALQAEKQSKQQKKQANSFINTRI